MRKIKLGKKIYDVLTEEEYGRRVTLNPDAAKDLASDTAIVKGDTVYPISPNNSPNSIGVCKIGPVLLYNKPDDFPLKEDYNASNIIDFENNTGCLREAIEKHARLASAERNILISKDNIYNVNIKETDTPEMKLFKEALNKKCIDIMSYKPRFSSDFSNDIRVIQGDSITFGKLKKLASILDMNIELTISDKENAPNPIGEVLHAQIND